MNQPTPTLTDDALDALLRQDLLKPPAGFDQSVMQALSHLPQQALWLRQSPVPLTMAQRLRQLLSKAAWASAGLLGLSQAVTFAFGTWMASAAL